MAKVCYIDFETRSACDLKACGSYVYAEDPTTEILCLAYAFDEGPVHLWRPGLSSPIELLEHVAALGLVVGHNIGAFEVPVWNNVAAKKHRFPPLNYDQVKDTLAMSYAMAIPGSLEKASAAMGITQQKDLKGYRVMLQLSQPKDVRADGEIVWWDGEEKYQTLYEYCKQDVEVERELFKRLLALSPREELVWRLDQRINARGVAVDLEAALKAISIVEIEKERLDASMRAVTENQVSACTATGQLTQWVRNQGVELDGVAKGDIVELLEQPSIPPTVRRALLLRQEAAKSSTAKLNSMVMGAGTFGRLRGMFQYHGAGTGRWAGRRVQLQNFPRPKISQDEIEAVFEILRAGK